MADRMRAFLLPITDPLDAARQQLDQLAQRCRESQQQLQTEIIKLFEADGAGISLQGATATALGQVVQLTVSEGERRMQAIDSAVTAADRCIGALESAADRADGFGVHPVLVNYALDRLDAQRLLNEGMSAVESVLAEIGRWVVDALNQGLAWVGEIVAGGLDAIVNFFEQGLTLISDGMQYIEALVSMLRTFGNEVLQEVRAVEAQIGTAINDLAAPLHHLEAILASEVVPRLQKGVGYAKNLLDLVPAMIDVMSKTLEGINLKDIAVAGKWLGNVSTKLDNIGGIMATIGFGLSIFADILNPKDFNLRKFYADAFNAGAGLLAGTAGAVITVASFGAKGVGALDTLVANSLPKSDPMRQALLNEGKDMSEQSERINVIDKVSGHLGNLYYDTTVPAPIPAMRNTPFGNFMQHGSAGEDLTNIGSDVGNFALSAGSQYQQNVYASGIDLAVVGVKHLLPANLPGVQSFDNAITAGALTFSQWTHETSSVHYGGEAQ